MATPLPAPRGPRPVLESVEDFKPTQVELAYGRIWAGIVRGRIPAGSRLVESRVAEELAMSRTPVREAIRRLEAEGLVIAEPNKGAVVRALTVDDVADLYDLRARLEAYGAGLAAQRRDADDLRALDEAAAAFCEAVESSAVGRERVELLFGTNAAFHGVLMESSRHARLQQMLARAVDRPLIHRSLTGCDLAHLRTSARFHELIADAVRQGAAERAERLTIEHVLQARDALVELIADESDETAV